MVCPFAGHVKKEYMKTLQNEPPMIPIETLFPVDEEDTRQRIQVD